MKNLFTLLVLVSLSLPSYAEQAFSKKLIENFVESANKLAPLLQNQPALDQQFEDFMMGDQSKQIAQIKSLDVYPKVESVIKEAGFNSLESYANFWQRLMAGMFKSQADKIPQSMMRDDLLEQLNSQISTMKAQGIPEEMIAQMQSNAQKHSDEMVKMKALIAKAQPKDVQFIKDNFNWLMSIMPEDIKGLQ